MTGAAEMNILESFCRFAGCPKVNGVPKVEVVLLPKAMFVWLKAHRQGEMACLSTDSCHSFMTPHMGQYHQELWHNSLLSTSLLPQSKMKESPRTDAGRRSCASTTKANPLLESSDAKIKSLKIEQFQPSHLERGCICFY